jgi:hypothetical protein
MVIQVVASEDGVHRRHRNASGNVIPRVVKEEISVVIVGIL